MVASGIVVVEKPNKPANPANPAKPEEPEQQRGLTMAQQQLEYRLGQIASAIQCSLSPLSASGMSTTPEEAHKFIDGVKGMPDGWTFFLELFTRCGSSQPEVAFVCLGTLTEIVKSIPFVPGSQQQQQGHQQKDALLGSIRAVVMRWLQTHVAAGTLAQQPSFICTKIAVLFTLLVKSHYPAAWKEPFAFLFSMVRSPCPHPQSTFEMFLRILKACMDEIIAYDQLRSGGEVARNVEIKRQIQAEQVIPQMIATWLTVLTKYRESDPKLCAFCLECMCEWIGWTPLEQVTTDQFLGVLFDCLAAGAVGGQEIRLGACKCLKELAEKGMGTYERLHLLRRLNIVEIIASFGVPGSDRSVGSGPSRSTDRALDGCGGGGSMSAMLSRESIAAAAESEVQDDEIDFAEALASLLNAVVYRLIVCRDVLLGLSKDDGGASHHRNTNAIRSGLQSPHRPAVSPAEATTVCDSLLSRAIEIQWGFFGHAQSFKVSEECVSSLSAALKTLAREVTNRVPNPHASQIRFATIVPRLVSILTAKIAYPASYTHGEVEDCEEDAMFDFYRETLCSLLTNVSRPCPRLVAGFVMEQAQSLFLLDHPRRLQSASMEEIEATLLLILIVRSSTAKYTQSPEFKRLIRGIHHSGVSSHPHPAVLLQYFDVTVKYHACLAGSPAELGIVLQALTSTILNPSASRTVRAQSCFHLRNICKELQSTLRSHSSYAQTILQAVHPLLKIPLPGEDDGDETRSDGRDSKTSSRGNPYIRNNLKKIDRSVDDRGNAFALLSFSDRLHLYDTCGLLISRCMEDAQVESLMRTLAGPLISLLAGGKEGLFSLCMSAGVATSPNADSVGVYFSRVIKAIGYVTKTFPPSLSVGVREIFHGALESAGAVLSALPTHQGVRTQCIFLLHRMVACLGLHLVPYLPASLPSLIMTTNSQNALETFQLINQFIAKYPRPMISVMVPHFVPIVQKLFSVMPQEWTPRHGNSTAAPTNAQVLAERLLNVFVLFIQNIVCNNMATTVLLDQQAALPFLPRVLGSLLEACKSVPDPTLVKSVFLIFRHLANEWIVGSHSQDGAKKQGGKSSELGDGSRGKGSVIDPSMAISNQPAAPAAVRSMFAKFLIEETTSTGLEVCVQFGYDASDAAHTILMHKEFCKFQRTVAKPECCGTEYCKYVSQRYIGGTYGCVPAVCAEYAHHLQGGTQLRAFGKFFAKLVQSLNEVRKNTAH